MAVRKAAATKGAARAPARKTRGGAPARARARGRNGDESIRRRIIQAAAQVYREHGYEQSSMVDVARLVGITAPALYWYFPSKEEILVAFLEHTIQDLIDFTRAFMRSEKPAARLWELVHAYATWQLQQKDISAAYERIFAIGHLRNSLPPRQRRRVKALEREFYGLCREVLEQGMASGDFARMNIPAAAFAIIGMVEHVISWFRPRGELTVEEIAAVYADMAVGMVTHPLSAHRAAARR